MFSANGLFKFFKVELSLILNSLFIEDETRIILFLRCLETITGYKPFLRRIIFNWKLKKVRGSLYLMVSVPFIKMLHVWLFLKNYLTAYYLTYVGDWLFKTITIHNFSLTIPFINKFFSFAKHALRTDKLNVMLLYNSKKIRGLSDVSFIMHPKIILLLVHLSSLVSKQVYYR